MFGLPKNRRELGFLAQEVLAVFPEMVQMHRSTQRVRSDNINGMSGAGGGGDNVSDVSALNFFFFFEFLRVQHHGICISMYVP